MKGLKTMTTKQKKLRVDITADEVDSLQSELPSREVDYIAAAMREAESCETAADLRANLIDAIMHAQTFVEEAQAALAQLEE